MASIGGVTTLTIASAITRAITGGGIFSLVSTMGLEGLFMGVGDTVIIYLLLRIAAGVKLRQLLQKARKHP